MSWHEQMVTVPIGDEGLALEGVWQGGPGRGAVIAPPHPEYGGSMDSPLCNELAYGFYKCEIASLRFNWRGVGASQGSISGSIEQADADYGAAVEHVAASANLPLIASGYSFGAAAALRAGIGDARIREVLLIAPPVPMMAGIDLSEFGGRMHVIVGGRDEYAPVDQLSELLAELPNATLDVIPEADHFFGSGLGELPQLIQSAVRG